MCQKDSSHNASVITAFLKITILKLKIFCGDRRRP